MGPPAVASPRGPEEWSPGRQPSSSRASTLPQGCWWDGAGEIGFVVVNDREPEIDPEFTALPLRDLADAAVAQAKALGAQHADFRAERLRAQQIGLSDGTPQTLFDADDTGLAVRVIVDGTWGFASAVDLTTDAAAQAARQAVEGAKVAAAMSTEPIELADEPGYGDVTWISAYQIDPFTISVPDKVALLAQWSTALLRHDAGSHVGAALRQGKGGKFHADGATAQP